MFFLPPRLLATILTLHKTEQYGSCIFVVPREKAAEWKQGIESRGYVVNEGTSSHPNPDMSVLIITLKNHLKQR